MSNLEFIQTSQAVKGSLKGRLPPWAVEILLHPQYRHCAKTAELSLLSTSIFHKEHECSNYLLKGNKGRVTSWSDSLNYWVKDFTTSVRAAPTYVSVHGAADFISLDESLRTCIS